MFCFKIDRTWFVRSILTVCVLCILPTPGVSQSVQFTSMSDAIDGGSSGLTSRETMRVQRFLSQVFPTRSLRRYVREHDRPTIRRVYYTSVTQPSGRYIIAGFTARWRDAADMLAIYRLDPSGMIEVWRSKPWEATYYGLSFSTARFGRKSLVLFREGVDDASYSMASLFTFQGAGNSLFVHDITPSSASLRVFTRFPFRPLYAQSVSLHMRDGDKPTYVLTASDGKYTLGGGGVIEPTVEWRLNKQGTRFERTPLKDRGEVRLTSNGAAK